MSNHDQNPSFGDFCWNELMTGDVKKAAEFYTALFGWKTDTHNIEGKSYTMFQNGDKGLGGMMQIPAGQEKNIPPHWMSYVNVGNLDEAVKKAQALGATITVPLTAVSDYGRFAIIADPTGAHIALWQSMKAC